MTLGLAMFEQIRQDKKANDLKVITPVSYSTGFMPLDYMNGMEVRVYDEDDEITMIYDSVGVVEGTMITVIADSGLGKSTWVQQVCTNITSKFDESFTIHEDIEQAGHANRIYNISGMRATWINGHYRIYQDCHAETVVSRFIDHAMMKINNPKIWEYDTGLKDMFGQPIKRLKPTCVIIDSLAVMRSGEIDFTADADKTTGNMAGARNAKFNSEIFKQILPYAKKANIIIFVVNHINKKVETGFIKSARDLVGLGENETLPGGRAAVYLANNVLRFKNKGQLKPESDYGINGHIIAAQFYKSRTNASQVECELIFDKELGFSKILTMLHFAYINDMLGGSSKKIFIPIKDVEDITFSRKTFLDIARQNPKLIPALYDLVLPKMREYLSKGNTFSIDETEEQQLAAYVDIMSKLAA